MDETEQELQRFPIQNITVVPVVEMRCGGHECTKENCDQWYEQFCRAARIIEKRTGLIIMVLSNPGVMQTKFSKRIKLWQRICNCVYYSEEFKEFRIDYSLAETQGNQISAHMGRKPNNGTSHTVRQIQPASRSVRERAEAERHKGQRGEAN